MPINERTIQWNLQVAGAPQAVNDMTQVTGAMSSMDDASRLAATRFTGVASASSALGTVLSRTTPQIGGLASALGTAGGATSGLVTAIGGTAGLVAGGLIAALSLAVDYFTRSKAAADEATDSWLTAGKAAVVVTNAITEAEAKAAEKSRQIFDVETVEDYQKRINRLEEQRQGFIKEAHEIQKENKNLLEGEDKKEVERLGRAAALNGTLIRRLQHWQRQVAAIDKAGKNQEAIVSGHEEIDKLLKSQAKSTKKIADNMDKWIEALQQVDRASEDIFRKWEEMADFDPFAGLKFEGDPDSEKFKRMKLGEEIAAEYHQKSMDRAEEQAEADEKEAQMKRQLGLAAKGAFDVVATSGANAFMELVKGNEVSTAAIIEGIGDQLYSKGIAHVLEAVAFAFIPGMQGNASGLAAAGAVEMATGLAMGAAGAHGARGEGGAGESRRARPTPTTRANEERRGAEPTTIYVSTLNPSVETGLAVSKSLDMAEQKRGRAAMSHRGR